MFMFRQHMFLRLGPSWLQRVRYLTTCQKVQQVESWSPKDVKSQTLESVINTLFGQGVFTDGIKYFAVRRLSWIIEVGPKGHKCSEKTGREELTQTEETHAHREGSVQMQAETGVAWPQSQECHRTPEAGIGKEWALPQGLQGRCGSASFQPLAFCEWINFHCFKSPSLR